MAVGMRKFTMVVPIPSGLETYLSNPFKWLAQKKRITLNSAFGYKLGFP